MEQICQRGQCCVCEQPLRHSAHANLVELDRQASWSYPVAGNVYYRHLPPRAVAFVCDGCLDAAELRGSFDPPIKYAIQIDGPHIVYHPVSSLPELPPAHTYRIAWDRRGQRFIQCLRCGRPSYNAHDIAHRYCGFCHVFHDD